jgi:hypothetical protein
VSPVDVTAQRHCRERRVPFWAALVLGLGCLDDPPTFAPRGQIPPFIIAGQVDPPLGAVYEGPSTFSINVPFRSEDVNIPLEARVYLDLVPGAAQQFASGNARIAPGNFEENRFVIIDWTTPPPVTGCHSLTLILTYDDNFGGLTGLPLDDARAARIVWWLNIGDINAMVRMANCPGASQADAVPSGG